jgi:voltage-gated potassium channel
MIRAVPSVSRRLALGALVLYIVLMVGTVGFSILEGWSVFEAFYVSVLVISTLGFSTLSPTHNGSRLLTLCLITGGVGTLYYFVSIMAQTVIETQLHRQGRRRMEQRVAALRDHYIVCGYGRVGRQICYELAQQRVAFVVVDNNDQRQERVLADGYLLVEGDASDDTMLQRAGIKRARGLLTAVATDAGNVYIILSARALNPKLFIVARASTSEAIQKLSMAGADRVISPYVLGGRRMANLALRPTVVDFLDTLIHSDNMDLWIEEIGVSPDSVLVGITLADASLRDTVGLNVLAIRHNDGHMTISPAAEVAIQAHDILIVLGTQEGFGKIR